MKRGTRDRNLPDVLYKYRPFSLRAVADMAANRVFLSSPQHFNDAYDCRIPWRALLSGEQLQKIVANGGPFAEVLKDMHTNRPEQFESGWQLNDDGQLFLRSLIAKHFSRINNCGICSLSAVASDLKMWAHYADSRRGFCLGFSTEHEPFSAAMSVTYSESIREVDTYKLLAGEISQDEAFAYLVTKADIWQEEREYRIFQDEPDSHVHYEPEALRCATFGDRAPVEHMVIVHSVLPAHVELFVASPTGNSYEFESVPVDRDVLERYR